jgi:phenylacetate-CoA ligase
MALLPGLRAALEAHFHCPALDVYSMNECGPVAVGDPDGHALLQHRLYVEILDGDGNPCPPGARGEVTLTGGLNFFLPLLRYRTNDYASLSFRGMLPVLVGLEGRQPVLFRGAGGQTLNNLDVTNALNPFALPQYTLHQASDGALQLRVLNSFVNQAQVREVLLSLFGPNQNLTIEEVDSFGDKVVQYTSELMLGGNLSE